MSTLLVASTGGHLKELHHLYRRLDGIAPPYEWVTFDTPQSRSLLADDAVDFVPFVGGRDPVNVARNLVAAHRILADRKIAAVVSTGSSVALPYFALARGRRLPCHYVESAARIAGPSLTGRLMEKVPGVNLYTQYACWAGEDWRFKGSVFDSFEPGEGTTEQRKLRRVVVTLGTYKGYSFARLVRRLLRILPADAEVLWQTGDTDVSEFGISGHYAIPEHDLTEAMRTADIVIAHAGVGTALAAFEVGACPVMVPRRFDFGEHVDDHQIQIAEELGERGLVLAVDADALTVGDLEAASTRSVLRVEHSPTFEMTGSRTRGRPAGAVS